jgi:hypothetical protein
VAWFFSGAGGLIFFKHWPTFFLTFAVSCFIHFENNGHGMMSDLDRQKVKTLSKLSPQVKMNRRMEFHAAVAGFLGKIKP